MLCAYVRKAEQGLTKAKSFCTGFDRYAPKRLIYFTGQAEPVQNRTWHRQPCKSLLCKLDEPSPYGPTSAKRSCTYKTYAAP